METREYLTLKAHRSQLEAAVQPHLLTLSGKLLAKGLISPKSNSRMKDDSKSMADRAANLVAMIMNMVKVKPEHYNTFVEVLHQCGINVLQKLKRERATTVHVRSRPAGSRGATVARSATIAGRPTVADGPVLIEGYLHKLGRRFKGWHRRYFRIRGCHMYYFKTAKKDKCLGEINLANCHYCEPSTAATFGAAFEIHTTQRSHTLAAPTKGEMQKWIEAIKQNIPISETAYVKLREARRISTTSTTSKHSKMSKRFSFNEAAYSPQDFSVDMHRERYQAFYEEEVSKAPPTSSSRRHSTNIRMSLSAEPITEVEVYVDSRLSARHTIARSKPPPPRPPPPIPNRVGGVRGGVSECGKPFVPTFLRNRTFQWDRVRKFVDYAGESTDKALHDTLPPQETPWLEETSPIEQLRMFLLLDP